MQQHMGVISIKKLYFKFVIVISKNVTPEPPSSDDSLTNPCPLGWNSVSSKLTFGGVLLKLTKSCHIYERYGKLKILYLWINGRKFLPLFQFSSAAAGPRRLGSITPWETYFLRTLHFDLAMMLNFTSLDGTENLTVVGSNDVIGASNFTFYYHLTDIWLCVYGLLLLGQAFQGWQMFTYVNFTTR